jgi:hypothetical protein
VALIDLKSDLSKWRRPVEKSLVDNTRTETPKPTNLTPLSDLASGVPSPQRPTQTATKSGVTPTPYNNAEKFKGETNTKPLERTQKFLGETTPTLASKVEKFKGETTPTLASQVEKFKGETTPSLASQVEKFKGETTPTPYNNTEKFKGETTPNLYDNTEEFKGETTPKPLTFQERFLGETTPKPFTFQERFLGETEPELIEQGDKDKGETTPRLFTSNRLPDLEDQAKDFGVVDFFTNDKAIGFTPKIDTTSKFVGVNPSATIFDTTTSIRSLKDTPVLYKTSLQLDNGLGKNYSDSVLKDTYNGLTNKSGGNAHELLKQDAFNTWVIKQPFIVTGIQDGKGKEFNYGPGGLSFIRGGAVTATTRALFDVARISQFLLTPRGIIWGLKQVGMQRSQRWGKIWTPANLLATIGGQHIGFRPDRQGTFPGDDRGRYDTSGKINNIYKQLNLTGDGLPFALSTDVRGGFDSVYGIGITTTTRGGNTFNNASKDAANLRAGGINIVNTPRGGQEARANPFKQKFNPFEEKGVLNFKKEFTPSTYGETLPTNVDDKLKFGVIQQTLEQSPIPIDEKNKTKTNLLYSPGFYGNAPDVADYEFLSYGKIKKRADEFPLQSPSDFRSLYDMSRKSDLSKEADYTNKNIHKSYGLPNPLSSDNKIPKYLSGADSVKKFTNDISVDPLNNTIFNPEGKISPDFVTLFFATDNRSGAQDSSKIIQFRSTISGLTETYSPSYNPIKYPGRADQGYMYESFERTLSFNFKVYANSRREMKNMWLKVQELAKLTLPDYSGGPYSGQLVFFRLGDLWGQGSSGIPSIITALTYTYNDDHPWDINYDGELGELPMGVDVNISLTLLPGDATGGRRYDVDGLALYSYNTEFATGTRLNKAKALAPITGT